MVEILIQPNLVKEGRKKNFGRLISAETSEKINKILRKVVTEEKGTASLADIYGYDCWRQNWNLSKLQK